MMNPHLSAALASEHRAQLMKEAAEYRQTRLARTMRSRASGPSFLNRKFRTLASLSWVRNRFGDPRLPLSVAARTGQ
jgi:hypothetical protein